MLISRIVLGASVVFIWNRFVSAFSGFDSLPGCCLSCLKFSSASQDKFWNFLKIGHDFF